MRSFINIKERIKWMISGIIILVSLIIGCSKPLSVFAQAPYPPSPVIESIVWDFSSHNRQALGSDNWPITWADDDNQYTVSGDGPGFNTGGWHEMIISRITGNSPETMVGTDVSVMDDGGKSYGIISVGGILYMWTGPGSGGISYNEARMKKSTNRGQSWISASWAFVKSEGMIMPTILNFGKDNAGARDNYVYHYFIQLQNDSYELTVHKPGIIYLLRSPNDRIMDRSAYEFFAGFDINGNPKWTANLAGRQPVFQDTLNGVGWNLSVSYNPGLQRYFLITEHTATVEGNIGIFDAPAPWGPWTTVLYAKSWGSPAIDATTFFWNFSNKWLSTDGKDFTLIFTGVGSNDSWNTVRGSFLISAPKDMTPPNPPTGLVVK